VEIEQHRRVIGVNEFVTDEPELTIPTPASARKPSGRSERMAKMRAERNEAGVRKLIACGLLRAEPRTSSHTRVRGGTARSMKFARR
jgi:hypothetical protein